MSKKDKEIQQAHAEHPEDSAWMLAARTSSSTHDVYKALDAEDEKEEES